MNATELSVYAQEQGERFWRDAGEHWLNDGFDLPANALVVEVGGYLGNWTDYVARKYDCWINVYEPVKEYYDKLAKRFNNRPKINVLPCGVEAYNGEKRIAVMDEGSSMYCGGTENGPVATVVDAAEIVKYGLDLLSINAEGAEYNILDRMVASGGISNVSKLLVQFHTFYPDADERRASIREKLSNTHYEKWCYPWIWEMWVRK